MSDRGLGKSMNEGVVSPTPTPLTDALYEESEMSGVKIERLWNHARKLEAQALESNKGWAQRWWEANRLLGEALKEIDAIRAQPARPWRIEFEETSESGESLYSIWKGPGHAQLIATSLLKADADRIMACIGACEGVSTLDLVTVGIGMHGLNIAIAERDRARAARDMQEKSKINAEEDAKQAHHDKKILSAWCYDLRAALKMLLPLAESYLKDAPSSPDNAKLETARGALAKTHHLEAL